MFMKCNVFMNPCLQKDLKKDCFDTRVFLCFVLFIYLYHFSVKLETSVLVFIFYFPEEGRKDTPSKYNVTRALPYACDVYKGWTSNLRGF